MYRKIKIFKQDQIIIDGKRKQSDPELYCEATAKISSLTARELYEAMEKKIENAIVFELRNCKKVRAIRSQMKKLFIEYDGQKFDLYYADCKKTDDAWYIIKANAHS